MAQEPSKGCLLHSFEKSAVGALRAALATERKRWPLIEVKVLSLSNVRLS